jgi:hypothetical protein
MQATFFGIFQNSPKKDKSPTSNRERSLTVRNIYVAIFAHENWKHRFLTFVEDTSKEVFTPEQVYFADHTELGQWIQTVGKASFSAFAEYALLVEHHKMFHYAASNAVSQFKAGKHVAADKILTGVFESFSDAILADLLKLRDKVEAIPDPPR